MAGSPAAGEGDPVPATLVTGAGAGGVPRPATPVYDWLVVGRECAGIDPAHRLVIDDPAVSRIHLGLRLDFELDQAWLTDHSTNGTRLNGKRIAHSIPVQIRPGDLVRVGGTELRFCSGRFAAGPGPGPADRDKTIREIAVPEMVMVVGDIVGFSTIAELTDGRALLEGIDVLYSGLGKILARHQGTLSNYVGDAFFATWESHSFLAPEEPGPGGPAAAARAALSFAVEASEAVPRIGAGLGLRDPGGGPVRMGWGVARGPAAVSHLTQMLVTVLGDATNVAFRLASLAGRDGRPDVLATGAVHQVAAASFAFTPPSAIQVKGRAQPVEVLGASRL